jgi:hypothetical protein
VHSAAAVGCRTEAGAFSPQRFVETVAPPAVKMVELKLSQGAKPAHGGILPAAKVSPAIAEARGVAMGRDCLSPLRHSAFAGPRGLVLFLQRLRELSGGKPVGIKLCVGQPEEFCAIVRAMVELDITPDFITVDGAEGGTGAAPPEFSNSVGAPMEEGLALVHGVLRGAGLRDRVRVVAAGKILTGFGVVRTLALGADTCNAARAMMFALGCIQALKCNSNACPTGVTTQNPELTAGLVPEDKALRVYRCAAFRQCRRMHARGTDAHARAPQLPPRDRVQRAGADWRHGADEPRGGVAAPHHAAREHDAGAVLRGAAPACGVGQPAGGRGAARDAARVGRGGRADGGPQRAARGAAGARRRRHRVSTRPPAAGAPIDYDSCADRARGMETREILND